MNRITNFIKANRTAIIQKSITTVGSIIGIVVAGVVADRISNPREIIFIETIVPTEPTNKITKIQDDFETSRPDAAE